MDCLYTLPKGVETRWASPENFGAGKGAATLGTDGRKRSPCFPLKAGESRVLAHVEGVSGTVRRIWFTIAGRTPAKLRGLKLEMFWDGADKPAVSCPFGDFFCQPLGQMTTFQSALFSSPEGRSFNCYVPMPFRTGMKIVLTNESSEDESAVYFDVDFTIGDQHDDSMLYFHAYWNRQNPTTPQQDYELLPLVKGKGRLLGVCIGVNANSEDFRTWWGEGEVKVYLDGDRERPTLCGTGTEDYIGTGWGQGQYAHMYQGCHFADHPNLRYGFYRLHVPDPIYFHQEIRATIQQIGCWSPENIAQFYVAGRQLQLGNEKHDMKAMAEKRHYGLFERADDWSSCAFFYLDRPTNDLPALQPVADRIR